MMTESRTRSLVLTGLAIALISSGAFVTIPFGPVPFTLQTLMLGIVVCLLPPAYSVAAVGGYLALGCLGLPVFSGFRGGIGVLAGPTGGFLVGYLLATIIVAVIRSQVLTVRSTGTVLSARPTWLMPLVDIVSLALLALVYYTLGCLWFMVSTGASFEAALAACVLPFIVPDIIKAAAAFMCVQPVRSATGLGMPATQ